MDITERGGYDGPDMVCNQGVDRRFAGGSAAPVDVGDYNLTITVGRAIVNEVGFATV